jgi:hypothetical protein
LLVRSASPLALRENCLPEPNRPGLMKSKIDQSLLLSRHPYGWYQG